MKDVRSILETEVWSARTSKRIVGLVVIVCSLIFVWSFLQRYWVNPWEHTTLDDLLHRAEIIRFASSDNLNTELEASKVTQLIAEQRIWTNRDLALEALTSGTVSMAMICRRFELRPDTNAKFQEEYSKVGEYACHEYDVQMASDKEALRTHLGF